MPNIQIGPIIFVHLLSSLIITSFFLRNPQKHPVVDNLLASPNSSISSRRFQFSEQWVGTDPIYNLICHKGATTVTPCYFDSSKTHTKNILTKIYRARSLKHCHKTKPSAALLFWGYTLMLVYSLPKLRACMSHLQDFKTQCEVDSLGCNTPLNVLSNNDSTEQSGRSGKRKPQHDHGVASGQN